MISALFESPCGNRTVLLRVSQSDANISPGDLRTDIVIGCLARCLHVDRVKRLAVFKTRRVVVTVSLDDMSRFVALPDMSRFVALPVGYNPAPSGSTAKPKVVEPSRQALHAKKSKRKFSL